MNRLKKWFTKNYVRDCRNKKHTHWMIDCWWRRKRWGKLIREKTIAFWSFFGFHEKIINAVEFFWLRRGRIDNMKRWNWYKNYCSSRVAQKEVEPISSRRIRFDYKFSCVLYMNGEKREGDELIRLTLSVYKVRAMSSAMKLIHLWELFSHRALLRVGFLA